MSVEYFLDTNILVYAFDQTADEKRTKALESSASILYSEDLQHNRVLGHLQIINPFLNTP